MYWNPKSKLFRFAGQSGIQNLEYEIHGARGIQNPTLSGILLIEGNKTGFTE